MLDDTIIAILRCPQTKQPLRRATEEEKRACGFPLEEETLATVDGTLFYRTLNELPVLISATEATG